VPAMARTSKLAILNARPNKKAPKLQGLTKREAREVKI
jgi:hypothetical protein